MVAFTEENIKRLLEGGYDKAVRDDKQTFIAFYSYLFHEKDPCTTCNNKLSQYWRLLEEEGVMRLREIQEQINNKKMAKEKEELKEEVSRSNHEGLVEGSFKLRKEIGALQMDFGSAEWFNNDTLTNEIALRYLSINKNRIANFEQYPEDWEAYV